MLKTTSKNLIIVQVISILGLIACVALKPHGLVANAGLSYFGNFKRTIIPYAVVLLGGSWFYHKAANSLPDEGYKLSKIAFIFFSILYIGLFITPYTLNGFVDWTHTIIGTALFCSELILTAWIALRSGYNRFLLTAWMIEFIAGVVCAIYTPTPTGYLLESQIIFQIAFTSFYVKYLNLSKSTHKYTEIKIAPLLLHK